MSEGEAQSDEGLSIIADLNRKIAKAIKQNKSDVHVSLVEKMADFKNEKGLYEEARQDLLNFLNLKIDGLTIARLKRKIAFSHTLQKTYREAPKYIEEAKEVLFKNRTNTPEWHSEHINILLVESDVLYFGFGSVEQIIANNESIKQLLKDWGNERQELQYYRHVLLIAYRRYSFFNFPDEVVSHAVYYRHLAEQKKDESYISDSLENLGFIYLWRHDFKKAIETYKECIQSLKGKQADLLMISTNYIALAYRMTNKICECEEWTNKAYQLAEQMANNNYLAQMLGNFGWLSLKRNNQLYAENFSLKGFSLLSNFRHPLLWPAAMPLIFLMCERKDWESAGKYAHCLLHPRAQKLPPNLETALRNAVIHWQLNDMNTMEEDFSEVMMEAQLTHYF